MGINTCLLFKQKHINVLPLHLYCRLKQTEMRELRRAGHSCIVQIVYKSWVQLAETCTLTNLIDIESIAQWLLAWRKDENLFLPLRHQHSFRVMF